MLVRQQYTRNYTFKKQLHHIFIQRKSLHSCLAKIERSMFSTCHKGMHLRRLIRIHQKVPQRNDWPRTPGLSPGLCCDTVAEILLLQRQSIISTAKTQTYFYIMNLWILAMSLTNTRQCVYAFCRRSFVSFIACA